MKKAAFVSIVAATVLTGVFLATGLGAPPVPSADVPIGHLPRESVTNTLKKTLSAQGRHVILPNTGTVRIYDDPEHIQAARRALEALQKGPANVSIEVRLTTGLRRVVRQALPPQQPVVGYEVPFPRNYDPPRISNSYSGGGFVIVPAQPTNFTTRRVGPGSTVNLAPSGYATLDSEVRMSETSFEDGVMRRLIGSAILGKPTTLPILPSVPDVRALREWAQTYRAIQPATEPEWPSAGTELVVTPELSNGNLSLNILPQIVVHAPNRQQPGRRIPLTACATVIPIEQGRATTTEGFAGADAGFYRLFFGAIEAKEDTSTSMSCSAAVRYLGL